MLNQDKQQVILSPQVPKKLLHQDPYLTSIKLELTMLQMAFQLNILDHTVVCIKTHIINKFMIDSRK
ncbi:hypothetical protein AGMMS49545_23690 [Betaproteobacteria bacterium]|nr:hypothetical protein AGMMS49545_23690 [Betaproteobacteria bacterium]